MTTTALVVDDEVDLCRLMQITLTKMGIKSDVAYTLAQARSYWHENSYDFCLTDLKLPDGSGLELVKEISNSSSTPIAVITAYGSMDLAIEALKLGAFDFVNKPLELPRLRQLVENALKVIQQDNVAKSTPECSPEQKMLDSRLIGNSAVMLPIKNTILKLARSQAPVFLSGASGTGKEVVASLIHDLSPRRDGSFVPVNCGAIPSELMESEFFGHKKGSFTGAVADKQGLFQQANGGTLFLDEVADLPLAMQVKLLRAIQEKTVRAIGDTKETPVDVRILSATHKNLNQLVQDGTFRQDLYYRINVIELKLPTLNARRDDIPVLAEHFLSMITHEWQLETPPALTVSARERLQHHNFAGNVRELRNVLERAVTLAETSLIEVSHLGLPDLEADISHQLAGSQGQSEETRLNKTQRSDPKAVDLIATQSTENQGTTVRPTKRVTGINPKAVTTNLHPYRTNTQHYPSMIQRPTSSQVEAPNNATGHSVQAPTTPHLTQTEGEEKGVPSKKVDDQLPLRGLEHHLQEQEKQLIITALKKTDWNKTQAAKLLGTTFRSLRYRMKKLEIAEDQSEE
ncbi:MULTISPECIES: sigma-54-dependent transcriptional regulator [Psychrobacter]|jgi:two-component system, NtrC family, response regulator PilR|uniref:sigma-54-dependent transcriptional regulator n=1 Tax=Psychrobacter TaxID=497 RepID=UPI000ECC75C1|nr:MULTISPECIES: sigma-54 dependent transcriptional regulator [Psychrobacter]HCN18641.1 sigma-54-dependent Fis family transcriptional regulator [Psychrobacter sp.]|tara:strand:- start:3808 stop:5526 length:1719 start_codon:yes stop_codon:yes gene_type:complete